MCAVHKILPMASKTGVLLANELNRRNATSQLVQMSHKTKTRPAAVIDGKIITGPSEGKKPDKAVMNKSKFYSI